MYVGMVNMLVLRASFTGPRYTFSLTAKKDLRPSGDHMTFFTFPRFLTELDTRILVDIK